MTGTEVVHTSGALTLRSDQTEWTEPQKAALAQLGVDEAPLGDQLVFLHVSQSMGLDPFRKEIYMIGRWDPSAGKKKWTIQVGIDGFRAKSEEHPQFGGVGDAEWCGPDGKWVDVWTSEEPPVAARFTVYRKDQTKPTRAVAHYREYVQTNSKGDPTQRWKTAPADQLAKCAEAKARRTAFPRQLSGVYAPEELQHLDNPKPAPVVIESHRETTNAATTRQAEANEPDWETDITRAENARDLDVLKQLWNMARDMHRASAPGYLEIMTKIAQSAERVKALDELGEVREVNGAEPSEEAQPDQPELIPDVRK